MDDIHMPIQRHCSRIREHFKSICRRQFMGTKEDIGITRQYILPAPLDNELNSLTKLHDNVFAVGHTGNGVHIMELSIPSDPKLIKKINEQSEDMYDIFPIGPDLLFVHFSDYDFGVCLCNWKTNEVVKEFNYHQCSLLVDDTHAFFTNYDTQSNDFCRLCGDSLEILRTYPALGSMDVKTLLSPDGKVFRLLDSALYVYDIYNADDEGRELIAYSPRTNFDEDFDPDCEEFQDCFYLSENKFACLTSQGIIQIWDMETCELISTTKAHSSACNAVVRISNNAIISCGDDDQIKLWRMNDNYQLEFICELAYQINPSDIILHGDMIISVGLEEAIWLKIEPWVMKDYVGDFHKKMLKSSKARQLCDCQVKAIL